MDAERFSYLLKTINSNSKSKQELCSYCLSNFKRRLVSLYGFTYNADKLRDIAHDIFVQFLKNKPKHYIFAPYKYINKVVDHYMANYFKNKKEELPLTKEISYEQRFIELEKLDVYNNILSLLDERSAKIVYLRHIENLPEKQIAIIFDISYQNTRAILCRAMKKLKKNYKIVTD